MKTQNYPSFVLHKIGGKRRLECRSSVGVEEDSLVGVPRKKLAVFVSGGGSNFRAIHEVAVGGLVHGDVVVVVTNKPGCGGAQYARDQGIPVLLLSKTSNVPEGISQTDLVTSLRTYHKAILNIHPSLLPAFGGKGYYGMKVHKAVIASGARYSGPTVHFVDEHYDTGRILAQKFVPVFANDTEEDLATRVLLEEHRLYVEVTSALCEERIVWREDGVPLIRSRENPNKYI
ncbi:hypothetical protein GIB67_039736 [Kingdonia uniflora]|uniref:phosphoribosylglycinamide formyltransferase 1 n=1 Tax=Kingdonia uniflora TaxID=39325 RepID=A0A7J7MPW1_9MAGN|nr:hypothetical protein GIB67_039736 [Kingdonia uniflora]